MKNKLHFIFILIGLTLNNVSAQTWLVYDNTNTILSNTTYRAVKFDASGNLWTGGSYSNLFKFNGTTWTKYTTTSGLLHSDINAIEIDNSNKVWVGNYKGISVYNGSSFMNYDTSNAGFNGMTVYTICKDNSGDLWISSRNGSFGYQGVTVYNGSTWTNLTGYPSTIVNEAFDDYGFATSGTVWMATGNGFTKYSGSTFTFYPEATTGLWSASTVEIDPATGVVYAGGFDGLLKYSGSSWTMYDNVGHFGFPSNTFYYDVFIDGGYIWMGTSYGLIKVDKSTMTVVANYKSTNSPLDDNCVADIEKDASGNLWLATTIGIVKLNPTGPAGVEEEENDQLTISSFPNPANDIVHISLGNLKSGQHKFFITDVSGSQVMTDNININNFTIDISSLSYGVYFINIKEGNEIKGTHKIVIAE